MKNRILALFLSMMVVVGYYIYYNWKTVEVKNASIQSEIAMHEDIVTAKPPPPRVIEETKTIRIVPKKGGKGSKDVEEKTITTYKLDRTETDKFLQQQQVSLELIGVLKLQLNPNNSWETIAQLLVLLLFSYGGVKAINKRFK
jgi:hypothetical protein